HRSSYRLMKFSSFLFTSIRCQQRSTSTSQMRSYNRVSRNNAANHYMRRINSSFYPPHFCPILNRYFSLKKKKNPQTRQIVQAISEEYCSCGEQAKENERRTRWTNMPKFSPKSSSKRERYDLASVHLFKHKQPH
uniref:Uncharacterized protein n=1 Tax=Parascaris univalens TaxID=6257 RepID=A0A915CKC5_PARUN